MDRLDGKGFKPWIRPHIPHRKRERAKLKVIKRVTPKAWQVAMMKLGMNFISEQDERIKVFGQTESGILETGVTTLEEPICADLSCGEVGDYAMLQADPSRPPPEHGWLRKAMQYAAVFLLGILVALANACHKGPVPEPAPEPDTPTPAYPPIDPAIALDTIIIDWNWSNGIGWAPPKYLVQEQTNKPNVRTVFINLTSPNSSGHTPANFHNARDTLQTRLDIHPQKVRGMGTIYINPAPGADSMPNHDSGQDSGIAWYDKQWFEQNGWKIKPWVPPHGK